MRSAKLLVAQDSLQGANALDKSKLYVGRDYDRYVQEANDAEVLEFILSRIGNKRITVIGDVMLDVYINGTMGKLSPEGDGDFHVLKTTGESEYFGGAAHVAAQLKVLGCNVRLFSVVGCDEAGAVIRHDFQDVVADPFVTTTTKIRLVSDGKQIARADHDMVSQYRFYPGEILTFTKGFKEALESSDVIVISDYNKGIICQAVLDLVHNVCAEHNIPLIVDPKCPPFDKYFPAVTIAPNQDEFVADVMATKKFSFGAFFELPTFYEVYGACYSWKDVDNIVITRGSAGIRVASRSFDLKEVADFPTARIDVPNVCGAGDVVTAYLAAAEAVNVTVWQAARLANLAAGLAVKKEGTPIVSSKEIFSHLGINARTD